eukprot:c23608_g2_i3 orf=356-2602(+)
MEAQNGNSERKHTGSSPFLQKGKSDSIIVRWTSSERKFQADNSMPRIMKRKGSALPPPSNYSLYDVECDGDHSSSPASYNNMISRTSSTASLSLGIAGPLIFPSKHALTSIGDGSKSRREEVDSSDESKSMNTDQQLHLHELNNLPPSAPPPPPHHSLTIANDRLYGDHDVSPPPPLSLKFVNVTYKVGGKGDEDWEWRRRCKGIIKRNCGRWMKRAAGGGGGGSGGSTATPADKRKQKKILKGITGYVLPGEVLALMGPSGSGKTTLLNLLSGRFNISSSRHLLHGTISYNDMPYSKALKRRMGFVMQDDVLYPHLTVKETLTYAAILRLPKNLSKKERMERAMEVIYELGLERCQDTIIGGPFVRGVSGGERKRVCMGQEILIDPSLLFLDEPTSGLDSTTALRIIHMLRRISQVGRTVVTTIHQPSSRLFHMFDKLILLSEGHLIYFGEAAAAMNYFSSLGFSPQLAMNPADFLLDLASGNVIDMSLPTHLLEQHMQTSPTSSQACGGITSSSRPSSKLVRQYLSKTYEATWKLGEKNGQVDDLYIKEKGSSKAALQMKLKEREWSSTWWSQFCVLYVRGLRERRHEYLSSLRILQVIISALIIGCLWWHSNLQTERHLADQGMGIAIGAIMMDLKKATTLASVTLLTFMLSGGFFVQSIPSFISWIRHISYNYHTFKLLVKVQYDSGQLVDCDAPTGCKKIVNSAIFHSLSVDGGAMEAIVLLSMIVGYRLIAYVALRQMKLVV